MARFLIDKPFPMGLYGYQLILICPYQIDLTRFSIFRIEFCLSLDFFMPSNISSSGLISKMAHKEDKMAIGVLIRRVTKHGDNAKILLLSLIRRR